MIENIIDNFRFLVIEAENQVKLTYGLVSDFNMDLLEKIVSKDDYIDNLKTTVENSCFSNIYAMSSDSSQENLKNIRALHIICVNLERIADYCVNIGRQMQYLSDTAFIHKYNYKSMFYEIRTGISAISSIFDTRDLSGALDICRVEYTLDQMYKENFNKILLELKQSSDVTPQIICSSSGTDWML